MDESGAMAGAAVGGEDLVSKRQVAEVGAPWVGCPVGLPLSLATLSSVPLMARSSESLWQLKI